MIQQLKKFIVGSIAAVSMAALPIRAQSTAPVVFVHGLDLDSLSWYNTRGYVKSTLYAQDYGRTINWRLSFENQRDTLISYLAAHSISNSSYLVGHSAGGVVARLVGALRRCRASWS